VHKTRRPARWRPSPRPGPNAVFAIAADEDFDSTITDADRQRHAGGWQAHANPAVGLEGDQAGAVLIIASLFKLGLQSVQLGVDLVLGHGGGV
jgi:hypothetical protein